MKIDVFAAMWVNILPGIGMAHNPTTISTAQAINFGPHFFIKLIRKESKFFRGSFFDPCNKVPE